MLTIKEYQNARASTLSSFYTPLVIVEKIYEILDQLGFKKVIYWSRVLVQEILLE